MTPDPYRHAYDKAVEDLTLISERFEQLNARKKQVETLVLALQPILDPSEHAGAEFAAHAAHEAPQPAQHASGDVLDTEEAAANFTFLDVPAPLPAETDGDPFQRRVKTNFRFKGLAVQHSH